MLLLPLLIAPSVMAAATLIERRLGPSAAGWVGALPIGFAVAVTAVPPPTAAALSSSAAAHVPAQILFGLVMIVLLPRLGFPCALTGAAATYVMGSLLLTRIPTAVAVVMAAGALWSAPRFLPPARPRPAAPRHWSSVALAGLGASMVAAAAVIGSRTAGPTAAGAVAAFPTVCTILTALATTRDGRTAGVHTMIGLIRSLPCYLTFAVVVALTARPLGPAAIALALPAALTVAAATWRMVPSARTLPRSPAEK